jgi:hypothetical protein
MAGTYNFNCTQGSTFDRTVVWKDSAGAPVDLTGCSARMQVRNYVGVVILEFNTSDGSITLGGPAGTVRLLRAAAVTGAALEGEWVYDLFVTFPDGRARDLLAGTFTVKKRVTQ